MAHRRVTRLQWARRCAKPKHINFPRARGTKAMGLRYEGAFAKALPGAKHGQWWEFFDTNGHGYCQTDFLLVHDGELFVIETKLTDIEGGRAQLEELYLPVIAVALARRVYGLVVSRSARGESQSSRLHHGLAPALAASKLGGPPPSLLWLGHAPLVLGPRPTFAPSSPAVA